MQSFRKDHLLRTSEENATFSCIFYEKDHHSFSVQGVKSHFREKEISSFPIIQERSYSCVIFFGKTIFSGRLEKENMVFRAVSWLNRKGEEGPFSKEGLEEKEGAW